MTKIIEFLRSPTRNIFGLSCVILASLLSIFWALNANPPPCAGDCELYTKMTYSFIKGIYEPILSPMNIRIGIPYIASKTSSNPTFSFIVINTICEIIFVISTFLIARKLKLDNLSYLFILT